MRPTLAESVKILREKCPTRFPVRVRVTVIEDLGDANLLGKGQKRYFDIRLNICSELQTQVLMLTHEWAHCLAWWKEVELHDRHFGKAWAEAYRAVYHE